MNINWIGLWTLYKREVWRFMKVWNQTLTAPMVTTLLFFTILTVALHGDERDVGGVPFALFITPGLIMMSVVQNAFSNTSSSFILQKIQGVIVDLLMPPLSAGEITFSVTMGGVTRGVLVGIVVSIAMWVCVPYQIHDPLLAIYYVVAASIMMSLLGTLTGIWSQTFDQLAAITNYIITPLSFLSGTFYSVSFLPEFWQHVSRLNPFYYMIDGFRYAMIGYHDAPVGVGMAVLGGFCVMLWLAVHTMLAKGWRLKT